MILNRFPSITYDGYKIPNLMINLGLTYDLIKAQFTHRSFTIIGAPRPEQLSYGIYGSPDYEWVLLLINGVIDPWYGWIKEDDVVREYAEKKYEKFGGADGVHHYYDPITEEEYFNVVRPDPLINKWYNTLDIDKLALQFEGQLIPVTNVEYEINENEALRKISIIPPNEIRAFVDTFERVQNGRS